MNDFEKSINASDLIDWIMCAFPDWCVGGVREIVDHIEEMPSVQLDQKEKFDRIIRELGVNCAYDMPSFWCNQGKDYKVIPTKYHKGYMQALADVEKHMKEAEE